MPIKKAQKKESEAPIMDIPVAQVKIVHGDLYEEPQEITTNAGSTFTVDPNFNCLLEIVDDFLDGSYDGVQFYESFKMKETEKDSGEWELRDGTKFGALARARYGHDFFDSDKDFDENDFVEFVFQAKVQPKKNFSTGQITGSTLNYETIMAIPTPKEKKKADEKKAEEVQQAELEEEEDFDSIPF